MADKKISQLTGATTPLTGTEELAIVQGGSTVKATAQDVADLAGGATYTYYTALLTSGGASAPTPTVFENTLSGAIVWTRFDTGKWIGTLAGEFPYGKVWMSVTLGTGSVGGINNIVCPDQSPDAVSIFFSDTAAGYVDPGINGTVFVEIRVYP